MDKMSDSDSDCSCPEELHVFENGLPPGFRISQDFWDYTRDNIDHLHNPLDDAVNRWCRIASPVKQAAFKRMRMATFWLPILLKPDKSSDSFTWALKVGLVASGKELNMKQLIKINTVEQILKTVEKEILIADQAKHIVFLSCIFYLQAQPVQHPLVDAINWIETAGGRPLCSRVLDLGPEQTIFTALQFIFVQAAKHIKNMGGNLEKTMRELKSETPQSDVQKSDEMKKKGNDRFQQQQYEPAIRFYSKAIELNPENHIFYGNRAQCYIRCEKYLDAVYDGKCAILINPEWAKGHYRYSEALFYLGEVQWAIEANITAVDLCSHDENDKMVFHEQRVKFMEEVTKPNSKMAKLCSLKSFKVGDHLPNSAKATDVTCKDKKSAPKNKVSRNTTGKATGKIDEHTPAEGTTKDTNSSKSQVSTKELQKETLLNGTKKKVNPQKVKGDPQKVKGDPQKVKDDPQKVKGDPQKVKGDLQKVKDDPQKVKGDTQKVKGDPQKVKDDPQKVKDDPQKVKDDPQKVEGKPQKVEGKPQKVEGKPQKVEDKPQKVEDKPIKAKDNNQQKVKDNNQQKVKDNHQKDKNNQQNVADKAKKKLDTTNKDSLRRELSCLVQDGHTALTDLRSRNAEQAFSRALALLESCTAKDLGLSSLDVMLLLFGRAMALTDIGQAEELVEADKVVDQMMSFKERTFECLVMYARGRILLRENRFSDALEQFHFSLQILDNKILPGKLTWPLTKEVVKETLPEYFKDALEGCIETCKFPPRAVAICRLDQSTEHQKAQIYYSDKDFKGFVQICCCENCVIEYHSVCWKALKTSSFSDRNDKDFLQDSCLTPDCQGKICSIKIFDSTGLQKFKVEAPIIKPQTPKRPKVNQKCTSLKKIKSKEERRLKAKQQKLAIKMNQSAESENPQQAQDAAGQAQKAGQFHRDPIILQLSQNAELLREEQGLQVSTIVDSLRPWLTLDLQRGNQLAGRLLRWQEERLETVHQITEVVLERKNRVWARLVVQLLSKSQDINPKISKWAQRLDEAGLMAATHFVASHSEFLEQLDLSQVLCFSPLQEAMLDKMGMTLESFSDADMSLGDCLKQVAADDVRLFIWALEEHRDDFGSCHSLLDYYFDMMDGDSSVLKKESESENNYTKDQGRKKKRKHARFPGSSFVLYNTQPTPRQEPDFFEDQSLCFLNPDEPFRVPSQLRDQVAEFESEYSLGSEQWFDNPNPANNTLYNYFAQILEQRGPLAPEHPLLVGEIHNFPPEAQLTIQQAGGIEPFLLESTRFRKIGRSIAVNPVASVQRSGDGANLNSFIDPDCASYACSSLPVLPNPYSQDSSSKPLGVDTPGEVDEDESLLDFSQVEDPYSSFNKEEELKVDRAKSDGDGLSENGSATAAASGESLSSHRAAPAEDNMRSVAVNTELCSPFEIIPGDINEKQNKNTEMEKLIDEMTFKLGGASVEHEDKLAALQEEAQTIRANIEVTNQELSLFRKKLEEEVKMDQKEKKANQEALKSIKLELEEMADNRACLSQAIKDEKTMYDKELNDFLELSNQSASEKLSVEDEITRYKMLKISASRRSLTAQLSRVESSHARVLHGLHRELGDAKALIGRLDEAPHRFPKERLEAIRNGIRADVQSIERKISIRESNHRQLMEQVKSGTRVSELPSVDVDDEPEAAAAPLQPAEGVPVTSLTHQAAASTSRNTEPVHSVFKKAMERLASLFPEYSRAKLKRLIQDFRSSSSEPLSFSVQDLVSGVSNLILNQQEKGSVKSNNAARGAQSATPPPIPSAWQTPEPKKDPTSTPLNAEDPCIICHEDMNPDHICVLECRHSFHDWCIRQWLREKNTCPNCRVPTLLPDFPLLTSRRRQAP